uniref:Uncharacterized protein n=1 Tax=Daphnia galeata TaxID=27404 RepID=A0A8J2WJH1_9CRUS|nr:unnamed protein product [Daphnia galeata]
MSKRLFTRRAFQFHPRPVNETLVAKDVPTFKSTLGHMGLIAKHTLAIVSHGADDGVLNFSSISTSFGSVHTVTYGNIRVMEQNSVHPQHHSIFVNKHFDKILSSNRNSYTIVLKSNGTSGRYGRAFQFDATPFYQTLEAKDVAAFRFRLDYMRFKTDSTSTIIVDWEPGPMSG